MLLYKKILTLFALPFSIIQAQNTWSDNIASIIYTNCTGCHIKGGIAPFTLVKYDSAVFYANKVASAVYNREMPPWPADTDYRRYAHEKILSAKEIKDITDWVSNGTPLGNIANAPAEPTLQKGTKIQNANLRLKMPDYSVNTSQDEYRCFVLPTHLTVDQFLTEIEVVPGNQSAVHHVLVFHDTSTIPLQLDMADPNPGYLGFGGTGSNSSKMLGVWVPGQDPFKMPNGMGIKLEKQGYIIVQVHYPAGISNIVDSSVVYLKLTSQSLREVGIAPVLNHSNAGLVNGPLFIPANEKKTFYAKYKVPINISIFAAFPHMHLIGESIKAYGVNSNGDTLPFVDIPDWDFHWQRTYTFRKIQKLDAATNFVGEGYYNNTSSNPHNPNSPPVDVSVGEATTDEMLLVYFWYTFYQSGDENIVLDTSALKELTLQVKSSTASQIRISPNPVANNLHVQLPNNGADLVTILHLTGSKAREIKLAGGNAEFDLHVSDLPSGCYLLKVHSKGTYYIGKFIKE